MIIKQLTIKALTIWPDLGKNLVLLRVELIEKLKFLRYRRVIMVSNTRITKTRRSNKKVKAGSRRKAANRNKGTTPKFAIHQEK